MKGQIGENVLETVVSNSPETTFNFGFRIGEQLKGGEIILLSGPLGSGKTILVKGICAALGIEEEEVTSPTFPLVNLYNGRLRLYHVDLYRLDAGASAASAIDLDDLLADEECVLVIEWAERLGHYPIPQNARHFTLSGDGDSTRTINFD